MRAAVVYTMGKVGSDAMARALEKTNIATFHLHTLARRQVIGRVAKFTENGRLPPAHLTASLLFLRRKPLDPVFISSVRDPVARNLSAFFQNRDALEFDETAEVDEVCARFIDQYPHDLPLDWFDREFGKHAGVDVYSKAFDHKRLFVRGDDWIVFRADCPDALKSRELTALVGVKVAVKRGNETGDKAEGALYRKTRDNLKLPAELLDRMYDSRFARHFWTDEERAAMRARWS